MYERFSDRARKVLMLANQEAQRSSHDHIAPHHVLLGLVKEGSGVAANVLKNLGIDVRVIRLGVENIVPAGGNPDHIIMGKLPHTAGTRAVIDGAIAAAHELHHNYVGTEHLLLALLRLDAAEPAVRALAALNVQVESVREEILNLLGHVTPGKTDRGGDGATESPGDRPLNLQKVAALAGVMRGWPTLQAAGRAEVHRIVDQLFDALGDAPPEPDATVQAE